MGGLVEGGKAAYRAVDRYGVHRAIDNAEAQVKEAAGRLPPTPAPAPDLTDQVLQRAALAERQRQLSSRGRASTFSSNAGVSTLPLTPKGG